MRKIFGGFWFFVVLLVLFFLYFPTLSKYLELKRHEEKLNLEMTDLKSKIEELKKEADLIKNDPAHFEQVVREELGLVKPGEVVYKIVPQEVSPSETETEKRPEQTRS